MKKLMLALAVASLVLIDISVLTGMNVSGREAVNIVNSTQRDLGWISLNVNGRPHVTLNGLPAKSSFLIFCDQGDRIVGSYYFSPPAGSSPEYVTIDPTSVVKTDQSRYYTYDIGTGRWQSRSVQAH
ncbi:MAG: hypothetical protein JXA20_05155 [Spirochaetes bacterium]|nr:hypothetical protein [Spirochaetota bacterium]